MSELRIDENGTPYLEIPWNLKRNGARVQVIVPRHGDRGLQERAAGAGDHQGASVRADDGVRQVRHRAAAGAGAEVRPVGGRPDVGARESLSGGGQGGVQGNRAGEPDAQEGVLRFPRRLGGTEASTNRIIPHR